ncbi:hypothetical protein B1R32_1158 [Abditibacterium utsteinense]|uniref:Double zinc ribbon n=1 Tax=Abditibacterium utsteinense TaxID=1960156 RepID=A0A2S8SQM0_9BACT|nr:hypothetical protein B1R32_1158 [Abditibacterium utsteinense]
MANLGCRHCGGDIDSDTRRTQCRGCGALFPFNCAVCERKLRSPFPIFEDERYLTLASQPKPLCEDHFLRKCPDCDSWFQADENPGYFRCGSCAQKAQKTAPMPEWSDEAPLATESAPQRRSARTAPALNRGTDINTLILGAAGCAFLALIGWFLLIH